MFAPYALGYLLLSLFVTSIVISIRWVATRRLPRLGCALTVIVLVFVLFIMLPFSLSPSPPTPTPAPTSIDATVAPPEVAEMNTSQLHIVAKIHSPFLQRDRSVEVLVFLAPPSTLVASTSPTANQTQVTTGVTPVGTPNVAIQQAFGPNYDTFAVAQLSGSAFDIAPKEPQKQPLNQPGQVKFTWAVLPKLAGKQILVLSVTGLWVPKSGGTSKERPLGELAWYVPVEESALAPTPFFSPGEIHWSEIIMVVLGSALNVQWISGLVQEAQKKRKEKQEASSQRSAQSPPNRKHHKRRQ